MKKKYIVIIIAVIVLLGIGSYYGYGLYQEKQAEELQLLEDAALLKSLELGMILPGTWKLPSESVIDYMEFKAGGTLTIVFKQGGVINSLWSTDVGGPTFPVLYIHEDRYVVLMGGFDLDGEIYVSAILNSPEEPTGYWTKIRDR